MEVGLLIAGGANDPNIKHLLKLAGEKNVPVFPFLIEEDKSPSFFWDMTNGEIVLKNKTIHPLAVFMRRDVFHQAGVEKYNRSLAWYTTLMGWIAVDTKVSMLNRDYIFNYTNKLKVLELASKQGFMIPETYVTNKIESIKTSDAKLVAKPVMGGGYCHVLSSITGNTEIRSGLAANPAIVQQYIKGEDIRIYKVGNEFIGFCVVSDEVDYRKTVEHKIQVLKEIPKDIIIRISKLMNSMGLNWGAVDFKKCKQTGQWYFLEVNSDPMFSVFDTKAGGKISDAIFQTLLAYKPV